MSPEREPCPHPLIDGDSRKLFEGICPRCDVEMERHDEYGHCPCCDIRLSASGDEVVMHLEFDILAIDDKALQAGDRLKFIRKIDDDGDWKQPNA